MDERTAQRTAIDLKTEVQVEGETLRVFLQNLSRTGCLVDSGCNCFDEGVSIEITLRPHIVASGKVVWARNGHVGIRFDEQLHDAVVLNLGFQPNTKLERFKDAFGRRLPQQPKFS